MRKFQAGLTQLESILAATAAAELRDAYQRRSFPDVYKDPQSPVSTLNRALTMDDLTYQQRSSLGEMSSEFRHTYDDLCRRMVEIRMSETPRQNDGGFGRGGWQARMERQRELERIRSERDDLNHKTALRLRSLMTPDQVQRLGLEETSEG